MEEEKECRYMDIMLPGIFFMEQVRQLQEICIEVGFQGEWKWQWQWMNKQGEGRIRRYESNWMLVWRRIGEVYLDLIS